MVKIFITGCAKSGSTLLARLMHAFKDIEHVNEEISLDQFCEIKQNKYFLIGKRSEWTVFSQVLGSEEKERQLSLISNHNIKIINIVRDGRDVVKSFWDDWGVWNPFIWMDAIDQYKEYGHYVSSTIWYEDLINRPNVVQYELMKHFNFEKAFRFSDYPNFVPGYSFVSDKKNYLQRKITRVSINKDKNFYKRRPNDIEYFENQLNYLGYDVS